jgi:hypothetical protein
MQKRLRWEVEEDKPPRNMPPRDMPPRDMPPRDMPKQYPYATVVPLNLGRGLRGSEKMHTVNTTAGEFLRSEDRYKSNVKRAKDQCKPYVKESRKVIKRIISLEQNNERTLDELKRATASSLANLDKKTLRDMYKLELLQNNEIIMRYKDRLNELKRIQELIYRVHEAPLKERKTIIDASEIHHSKPYVQFLGTRVTQGGRSRKKKNKTKKVARVH